MRNLVTIGRFSERTHLTVKALRLYDKSGLLHPAAVDFQSGFRYYNLDQVSTAAQIRLLRSLEMPLEEIGILLQAANPETARACLVRHQDRLEERITTCHNALAALKTLEDRLEHAESGGSMMEVMYCRCSCCGKSQMRVRRLIVGPQGLYLCNECIGIFDKQDGEQTASSCSLCGAGDRLLHCLRTEVTEIGICDECLMLCQEIAGEDVPVSCSFCGKSQAEAPQLIAGPHDVYICSECVTGDERIAQLTSARCSFCNRDYSQVRHRLTGVHNTSICHACIMLCNELISVEKATT